MKVKLDLIELVTCNTLVACEGHIGPDTILIINNTVVVNLVLCNELVAHEGHIGPGRTEPHTFVYAILKGPYITVMLVRINVPY